MHRIRYHSINKDKADSSYPRCSEIEDWHHMIKCRCVNEKRTHNSIN